MGVVYGILTIVAIAYFTLLYFSIAFGFWKSKTARDGIIKAFWIIIIFTSPFTWMTVHSFWLSALHEWKTRPARKIFDERCTMAGEQVYKKIDNPIGFLLLNIREHKRGDENNLYWPDAALPYENGEENYIRSFLHRGDSHHKNLHLYVDVKEGNDFIRYRLKNDGSSTFEKNYSPPELARYAVYFINHDNPTDRKHGIAGTTITIKDTFTGEKIAERISYAFIPQFVVTGSIYWKNAITCPEGGKQHHVTIDFVNQVIKPKQEY